MDREGQIVKTSIIGIMTNVGLAAFKAFVGIVTHSIAITLDAVNNISDALSSVITIVGTKLAGRRPDKKHPFGHGRIEYLSAAIISVIVLYAGITSLIESVKKILAPEKPAYSTVSLVIVAVAVVVKIVLGRYVKKKGEEFNSESLIDSGKDAILDSVISASTLAAAVIFLLWDLSLEAWLGAVISIVIIRSGIEMLRETLSQILGERVEGELAKALKETVCSFDEVYGAYDLFVHNYGPDRLVGSVHIEVPDSMTADRIDILEREISRKVYEKHGVVLAGISIYSMNTTNDEAAQIRDDVRRIVMSNDNILQMHGFYLDEKEKTMRFDIVVDFAEEDHAALYHKIKSDITEKYPGYTLHIVLDSDVSD